MGYPAAAPSGRVASCTQCGTELNPGDKFCPKCGASAAAAQPPVSASGTNESVAAAVPRIMGQEVSRVGAAIWILASLLWIYFSGSPGAWIILLGPSLVGALWPLVRHPVMTSKAELCEEKFQSGHQRASAKTGTFARYFTKPLFAGCLWIWGKTQRLADVHLRAGIRVAAVLYFAAAMVTLLAVVGYVIVVVVVVIAVLLFMLWLLSEALSRGSGRGETSPANSAREESSAVNISEYRKGYEDGRAAAREPGRDLADSLLAIVDTPDYRRGYADGLNGRNFDP